jgi:environmental stress-induced protein Ves
VIGKTLGWKMGNFVFIFVSGKFILEQMEYKIITSENFKSVRWSGGTTKELFIFPPAADYQKRAFQFRLSMSAVEADRSDFTRLPGISRKLMVLSGSIILDHENHHTKQLTEFETDEFEGDWKTTSHGTCTDFNLMTTGEATGQLTALIVEKNRIVRQDIKDIFNWLFIYMYSGKVNLIIHKESIELNEGVLFSLRKFSGQILEIKGLEKSNLVFSQVYIPIATEL